MGDKLTLKHLAPYLPYGVRFISSMDKPFNEFGKQPVWTLDGVMKVFNEYCLVAKQNNDAYLVNTCKLILLPLSDLTKEIEYNGERFVPYEFLVSKYADDSFMVDWLYLYKRNVISTEVAPYKISQQLFKWHFDVFGLIDKGLAIDINTLEGGRDGD